MKLHAVPMTSQREDDVLDLSNLSSPREKGHDAKKADGYIGRIAAAEELNRAEVSNVSAPCVGENGEKMKSGDSHHCDSTVGQNGEPMDDTKEFGKQGQAGRYLNYCIN